jgi:Mn-containing catalase
LFYHDGGKLQYPVRVTKPNPVFARALQQAIGGVEGEIRVCLQYMFQSWGARGPNSKYRDLLLNTGTEEMGHIEMLATAVAMNLEGSPLEMEQAAKDPIIAARLGGMNLRHVLSTTLAALPVNCEGVPFDCSHIYASGNLAADALANVTAESTGRMLACQLYKMTDDPGMKDMLSFLIARDTMHQNQWLAMWEEVGGAKAHPIPNNFPQNLENQEVNYSFFVTGVGDDATIPTGRWSEGRSVDGRGEFKVERVGARGEKPAPRPATEKTGAQTEQIQAQAAKPSP